MLDSNKNWSLYNKKTDVQIDGLQLRQAQSIVSSLAPNAISYWKAWHVGLKEWTYLKELPQFFDSDPGAKLNSGSDQTSFNKMASFEYKEELEKSEVLIQLQDERNDLRINSRFDIHFEVKVQVENSVYECHTLNISLGGLRLDREIPMEDSDSKITCEIVQNSNKLTLICRAIPDPNFRDSARLIITKLSDPELLLTWLLASS